MCGLQRSGDEGARQRSALGRIMLSSGVVAMRSHVLEEVLEAAQTQLRRGNEHGRDQATVGGIVIGVSATS